MFILTTPPAVVAADPQFNVVGETVHVLLSLCAVVALIFVAGWLSRRMQGKPGTSGRRIRCVEAMSLSARDRVVLIEADGKRLLIASGAGGTRTLHVYEGEVVEVPASPEEPAQGFAQLLGRWKARQ